MGRSWRLGSWFGIGVYLHWTLLLVPVFFCGYSALTSQVPSVIFFCGISIPLLYTCVLLHEFGHALTARHFGIATQDITLYPIGGVARLERMSERPAEEFWIAIAGPLVNVAIAALAGAALLGMKLGGSELEVFSDLSVVTLATILGFLCAANVMLFLFNVLPAFPMDGGRILRALLSARLGLARATEIAAGFGLVMSALFVCVGLLSTVGLMPFSPLLVLVGLFVGYAGQRELLAVRRSHRPRRRPAPLEVLPASDVDGAVAPGADFSGFTWDQGAGLWIQWRDGQPVHKICVEPD
jgi:Zn-dependent protease